MLDLVGVSKSFGAVRALSEFSLQVPPGRIVGFVGPNGAGKTTAMRVILGVVEPDAGTVTWNGTPVTLAARRRFGYMPEERGLYPKMKLTAQLSFFARLHGMGRTAASQRATFWLERVGLGPVAGRRVEELSLGNQQRAQLAAALVHDPELLVLDEPFSGLDPQGVDRLSSILQEAAAAGTAVLFSSHQLELVERLCDDVTLIAGGREVAAGPVAQLRPGSTLAEVFREVVPE